MIVRAAKRQECELLSALALRSKGYWGYDAEFLEACRAELTLAAKDFDHLVVRVAEAAAGEVAGFYAFGELSTNEGEVWFFFVDLPWIGQGIGRVLFDDMAAVARARGWRSLRIDADPGAATFYERMGASQIAEVESNSILGRMLPRFELKL